MLWTVSKHFSNNDPDWIVLLSRKAESSPQWVKSYCNNANALFTKLFQCYTYLCNWRGPRYLTFNTYGIGMLTKLMCIKKMGSLKWKKKKGICMSGWDAKNITLTHKFLFWSRYLMRLIAPKDLQFDYILISFPACIFLSSPLLAFYNFGLCYPETERYQGS